MEFDTTQYSSTVIQEFGFVCDWHYLGPLSTSLFLLGPFLGNLIIGHMADRIGRLLTFIINIAIFVVFGLLQAVVRNAVMFMICNFMIGIPYFGIYNQALVLLAEIVGPSKRGTVTMACVLFYAFGYSVLPAIAYYVRDWSVLVLIINLHPIIFFSYWWILAESPRWLLSVGKVKKAKEVMQRMAKVNKVLLPDYIFESEMFETLNSKDSDLKMPIPENGTTDTFITIFRYSNTRKKTLIIYYCSASITLLYYGLTFNVGNLGGNDYTNALIAGAVEILAYSSSMYFVETQLGRKITISVLTVIAIIATISSAFIPQCGDTLWVMVAVYMIGKYATSAAYGVTQLYTGEIFPTTLRAIGVMSAVSLSILASALAPYLLTLRKIWNPLPQLVFGGLSIISACLVLILPETRGRRLPANIQEAEIFGKKQQEPGYEIINVQDKNCVELSEV
ncbi:organic cation transporter protein-like [Saccoglossus kowalevskii]|uniref:Organic cation transporter protein-like n=1 Tax=Saccoglossus kowalevskii TaxID=10224 RepID=A0ABM0LUR2_SACKO|nr:PREDICTED: organic cation transporter protein-like [Saccoglossus kowalevskii]